MPNFSRRARILCLLALLQLVGGPLVLFGVMTLSKVMVKETARHGVVAGISRAMQCEGWRAACDLIADATADDLGTKSPNGKQKGKELKTKFVSLAWTGLQKVPAPVLKEAPPGSEPVPLESKWPNGPPVPPPRWG